MGSPGSMNGSSARRPLDPDDRSRSRARGENERGRSRGVLGGPSARNSSQSGTSRVRGSSSAGSSTGGGGVRGREGTAGAAASSLAPSGGREHWPADAVSELTRLKTKISELTFLNGLMQSRLAQLEGPERPRVPSRTMTSLTAETPRPDMEYVGEEGEDEEMGRPEPIQEEVPEGYE